MEGGRVEVTQAAEGSNARGAATDNGDAADRRRRAGVNGDSWH